MSKLIVIAERAYRSWLQGAESVQAHALEFWNAELQKGIAAMNKMAQCATAAEAFGVQTRYATEAVQGLIAESQKVVEQLAAFTQTPWATRTLLPGEPAPAATATRSSRRRS